MAGLALVAFIVLVLMFATVFFALAAGAVATLALVGMFRGKRRPSQVRSPSSGRIIETEYSVVDQRPIDDAGKHGGGSVSDRG